MMPLHLLVANLVLGLGIVSSWPVLAGQTTPSQTPSEQTHQQIASEIARYSRQHVQQTIPSKTPKEMRKDGVYLLVSFSMPEETLKEYFRQAKQLGARVLIQGLVNNSFKETQTRIMRIYMTAENQPDESTHAGIAIDPVIFRKVPVSGVPALVFWSEDHYWMASGAGSVEYLLRVLARHDRQLDSWVGWLERRQQGFLQGGPTTEPRPKLPAISANYKVAGEYQTFQIAERDMITVMKEGIAKVDWEKVRQHEEEILKGKLHRGPGLKLPDAQSPRTFLVDMTMEYPEDITDPTSKTILVKAGARVNPLQKVKWPYAMIFLNADNQDQVRWARRYLDAHDRMYVKVAVTEGDIAEAMKALEHRVYWADTYLLQRFGVVAVPSVVKQEGERLKVQEYALR